MPFISVALICGYTGGCYLPNHEMTLINTFSFNFAFTLFFITEN
jgi:hypothetical protein